MHRYLAIAVALLALSAGAAEPSSCKGTLAGQVKGSFTCDVSVWTTEQGVPVLAIQPRDPIDGVPSCVPGAFELPSPVRAGTYTLDELGMGKASVAAVGGTLYIASKTTGQRGEVKLVLRDVMENRKAKGTWLVHGTYRARLIPASSGKEGEVVVEVTF
jgi:hypothetical protein